MSKRARKKPRWYRRCIIMAILAAGISISDVLTPGGASWRGQASAGVLLAGATYLALETRRMGS